MKNKLLTRASYLGLVRSLVSQSGIITSKEFGKPRVIIYAPPTISGKHFRSVVIENHTLKAVFIPSKMVESEADIIKTLETSDHHIEADQNHIGKIFSSFDTKLQQEFLHHLNQDAVSNLGIASSSQRIDLYNECIPERNFDDSDTESAINWQRAIRNRSKTIAYFPLILEAIKTADFHLRSKLLDTIDNRPSSEPTEVFKEIFKIPHVTSGFIRRIANAPDIESARVLYNFLVDGLLQNGKFDNVEFNRRVSNIPFPRDQEEYEAMWKILDALNKCKITNHAKAQIFLNIGRDWIKNASVIKDDFGDLVQKYSQTIADDLILPVYIKTFKEKRLQRFCGAGPERFKKFDDWFTDYARLRSAGIIEDVILSKLTPEKLLKYADRLERMTGTINEAKPLLMERLTSFEESGEEIAPEWHRTFPDQEINGIKFKVLLSSFKLRKESDEMHNCVVNLRQKCLLGESHVVSGISATGERFSVRFDTIGKGSIRLFEASGPHNKFVSKDVRETVDILCKKLSSGEIVINKQTGNVRSDFTIDDTLGFDITKEEDIDKVFKAYSETDIFPREVKKFMSDRDIFYTYANLPRFFANNMEGDINKSASEDVPTSIKQARAKAMESRGPRELVYLD